MIFVVTAVDSFFNCNFCANKWEGNLYFAQRLLMCVYFQIKVLINGSFAKAKGKLEQAKHNFQIKSEELLSINPLIPPQQSWGLGALDYETIVQNINTAVNQKIGSYQQCSKTNKPLAYSYFWFLNTDWFLQKFSNKKGNVKVLIYFRFKFPGLKESTVGTFK